MNILTGRINLHIDFEDIRVGDLLKYGYWPGTDISKFTIYRNLNGDELKRELLEAMDWGKTYMYMTRGDLVTREAVSIEVIDESKAIITYRISDLFQKELGNDEVFEIKILVTPETKLYSYDYIDGVHYSISDLETLDYLPEWVLIRLDQSTIDDEMPVATDVQIGLAEKTINN